MRLGLLAAATAVVLGTAGDAGAATVSMNGAQLNYLGGDEASQVTITRHATGFEVADPLAGVTAGTGCLQASANLAMCAAPFTTTAVVDAGGGNDWVRTVVDPGINQAFELAGGPGDDQLQGAAAADRVGGGPGQDYLFGHGGNDVVLPGNDAVKDTIEAGDGRDLLSYADNPLGVAVVLGDPLAGVDDQDAAFDVEDVWGGAGNDTIVGDDAPNDLRGGGGHDSVMGRGGFDSLSGEAGDDDLSGGGDRDNLYGSDGDDTMDGGDGDDNIHGDADDDTLLGGAGNDYLSAGGGVNSLDGGLGADALIAWGGPSDTVTYISRTAPVTVTVSDTTGALPPADDGEAGEGDNVIGAETVIGGSGSDSLTGTDRPSRLFGRAGNDMLDGAGGNDHLDGGSANDRVFGDTGADYLFVRDSSTDYATCGSEADRVMADIRDNLATDCESITVGK